MRFEPIVVSLLDTDLYKFNMDQVIFHKHTDLCGQYYFKCRNEGVVFTREMVKEINEQIDHLCTLRFNRLYTFYKGRLCGISPAMAPYP